MGLKAADALTVLSPQLRGSKCIKTLGPWLHQPGGKWASHFDGPFELPPRGIVLKHSFMSGPAQANPYYLELPAFVYCLAAGFKISSEKIKIEKEIEWLCALEKEEGSGEVQFVQLPGERNKLLFTATVENYTERGMGERVLVNSYSNEYCGLRDGKGI